MPFVKLTKTAVAAIAPGARPVLYNTDADWLKLLVLPSGCKSWIYVRRHDGRLVKSTLARVELMTPDEAREAVLALASGRREKPDRMTFGSLWRLWSEARRPFIRPTSVRKVRTCQVPLLSAFDSFRLEALTALEAQKYHRLAGDRRGRIAANIDVAFAGACWEWGRKNAGVSLANPFRAVQRFPKVSRRRILHGDELARFLAAVAECRKKWFRDFVGLALLTGARKSNILEMRWDELDLESDCSWTIPAAKFKGGRDMRVPLLPQAVEILRDRRGEADGGFVFQYRSHACTNTQLKEVCASAGITGLTIHDLRRTVGSQMAIAGVSLPTIAAVLGHADVKTTQIYAIIAADAARKGLESIQGIMAGKPRE